MKHLKEWIEELYGLYIGEKKQQTSQSPSLHKTPIYGIHYN